MGGGPLFLLTVAAQGSDLPHQGWKVRGEEKRGGLLFTHFYKKRQCVTPFCA